VGVVIVGLAEPVFQRVFNLEEGEEARAQCEEFEIGADGLVRGVARARGRRDVRAVRCGT
jgi:hypothetical protein